MKSVFQKSFLFLVLPFLWNLPVNAQDTHHWGNQFGTRSVLLGGAVLSDTLDNSGVYYNPGTMAFGDTLGLSINSNFYGLETIRIQNALGQKADFNGKKFNAIPLAISGVLPIKSSWKFNYGLLSPVNFNFGGVARIVQFSDLVPESESPGMEELVAESAINSLVQETMVALGVSKKMNPHLGFGLSLLNTLRSTEFSYRFSAKTLTNQEEPILISRIQNEYVRYTSLRTAIKTGLTYQGKTHGFGITLTSPGLNLSGKGTVAEDLTVVNIRSSADSPRYSAFASDRQEKLKANYKSPWQIAIGGHQVIKRSVISINLTHFGGIKTYRIISAEPNVLIRPDLPLDITSSDFLNVETVMKPVTNVAVGYENRLSEKLQLMGSFRTDFSYFDESPLSGDQLTTEISQWDIVHFSFGGVIHKNQSTITLGVTGSFGSTSEYVEDSTVSTSDPSPTLESALTITQANYTNFGILIGYSFRFKKLE